MPQPDGPSSTVKLPGAMSIETPRSARVVPHRRPTSISRTDAPAEAGRARLRCLVAGHEANSWRGPLAICTANRRHGKSRRRGGPWRLDETSIDLPRGAWNGAGMSILSGHARVAGIAGWPVTYSRSPRLHGFWLQRHGIDGAYIPLPIRAGEFATAMRGLLAAGFAGANVTIPHKLAAFDICDTVDDTARRAGAVNTLVFRGRQDRRQQHRRLWLHRQSARPWRGSRGRAGTVAGCRRLGACGRGGASGRRRAR